MITVPHSQQLTLVMVIGQAIGIVSFENLNHLGFGAQDLIITKELLFCPAVFDLVQCIAMLLVLILHNVVAGSEPGPYFSLWPWSP